MSKARNISNLFSASTDVSTDAEVTSAISTHSSAADPHSVYLKESDFAAAGKNKFLNADFSIWQRGSTHNSISPGAFTSDRWYHTWNGTGATRNVTRETFPSGTVLGGNNPQYFLRYNQSVAGTGGTYNVIVAQKVEDPRLFAGQTVTVSFWAKASASISIPFVAYWTYFGVGASGGNAGGGGYNLTMISENNTFSTSWTRYSYTFTMSSLSGVTIGSGAYGYFEIGGPLNSAFTADFWGFQIEQGPVATAFDTATENQALELAACQRYYQRIQGSGLGFTYFGTGSAQNTSLGYIQIPLKVSMRISPASVDSSALSTLWMENSGAVGASNISSITINPDGSSTHLLNLAVNMTSGTLTSGAFYRLLANNNSTAYLGISAEL